MKKRIVFIVFPIMLIAALFAGVNLYIKWQKDRAGELLLQNLTCEFPCWENITPGKTSIDNALSILRDTKEIEFNYLGEQGVGFDLYSMGGDIHLASDSTVDYIILYTANINVYLGDFVKIAGYPQQIDIFRELYVPQKCQATLLFPEEGVILDITLRNKNYNYFERSECRADINSRSIIRRIILLDKNFVGSDVWDAPGYSSKDYQNWKGYGEYP